MTRSRTCTLPEPRNGGQNCVGLGEATESLACNEQKCATPAPPGIHSVCELKIIINYLILLHMYFVALERSSEYSFFLFLRRSVVLGKIEIW